MNNNIIIDEKKIDAILERGNIVEILPTKKAFREELLKGKKLKFYIGFDATAPALHLGHARNIMILEEFRKLGHQVIVLFGDFTAQIGDPTEKGEARKQLTKKEVLENVKKWRKQIEPLLDFENIENPPLIKYNSDWLSKLNFTEVLSLAGNFTVQQMIERNMFQTRIKNEKPIYLHEFLYPLMQGWDSIAMDVDVELCGTDQIFNALAGRVLQKRYNNKEKFVVAGSLLSNPKTGEMMSKSKGTGVFVDGEPIDLFGQIMAQPDEMIEVLFVNCTHLSLDEINKLLDDKLPRDSKIRLAYEITRIFHKAKLAKKAQESWVNQFSKKELPDEIPEIKVSFPISLIEVLVASKMVKSKGEANRLLDQKGIKINQKVIGKDIILEDAKEEDIIIQKGKRHFIKLISE